MGVKFPVANFRVIKGSNPDNFLQAYAMQHVSPEMKKDKKI